MGSDEEPRIADVGRAGQRDKIPVPARYDGQIHDNAGGGGTGSTGVGCEV